jgi:hypothetical protein
MTDLRQQILAALRDFDTYPLPEAATRLFAALGYRSDRRLALRSEPEAFVAQFDRPEAPLNRERALFAHWRSIDLLFQLTDDELSRQPSLPGLDTASLKSYLFFALRLRDVDYPRGRLATIARAVNRLFSIPVLILFAHGDKASIAIINRRAHKREPTRDVLEKVSLIKDIALANPHRGHLDVLASFSIEELARARPIRCFDDLHAAWSERLNIELLNKRFYKRVQEWFFWAAQSVRFPPDVPRDLVSRERETGVGRRAFPPQSPTPAAQGGRGSQDDLRNRVALIRMLTRVIFCWFARQKGLIPAELFRPETADSVLKRFDLTAADDGAYYLAVLQNLFFPTLAVPLDQREFRNGRRYRGVNKHYMDHRFYRHEKLFRDPEGFGALFERIPFLNGGLFECLDTGTCKADEVRNKPERRLHAGEFGNVTELPTDEQEDLTYRAFFPEGGSAQTSPFGMLIGQICYVSYGLRPNSDENEAKGEFTTAGTVSDTRDKKHCKPYVEGKHLGPWLSVTNQWIEWRTARAPARFCRPTFPEMYAVEEKIIAQRSPGPDPVVSYDDRKFVFTPASVGFVPWHMLSGVRNNSLKKAARYKGEKPPWPDLPQREELEKTSRRFAVKYLLAVMNSSVARDFLRANRRSNIHLYPDDWKKLPIPDVDAKTQTPIVKLVDQILAARRADPKADIAALEREVDGMVARLYGVAT